MNTVILGSTGIKVRQNQFGALPIQRDDMDTAVKILQRAYEGGMTYFDTARAYTDSEEKIGKALCEAGLRDRIYIATKTQAKTPDDLKRDLDTSLRFLKTDHIDIYQLHMADRCYREEDGTGMYECLLDVKRQGMIKHIGITAHKINVAMEIAESGIYETLQFPFSYLSSDKEIGLVNKCRANNVGFIAMKGLAGGLITRAEAAMAFMTQYDNVLPIWGIQHMEELEEWLSFMDDTPVFDGELKDFIAKEREELSGEFCRGCGYCMPCPMGIKINNCARTSLMLRRAPSKYWLSEEWQAEMKKIETCIGCNSCSAKCPYELDTPELLKKNLEDYRQILEGKVKI
ncbi:MAG: aldo/keto reductase [Lachnospiraceae bacterium]|nr:aldo/keto reductase [Lachnospiraceae bacterium]